MQGHAWKTYTYRITALLPGDIKYPVVEVRVTAASITPLTAPTDLQEMQVLDMDLSGPIRMRQAAERPEYRPSPSRIPQKPQLLSL